MKILYVTRHFNHSGYLILKRLLEEGFDISGILLHEDDDKLRNSFYRFFYKLQYYLQSKYYGFSRLKNFNSEESLAKKNKLNIIYSKSIKSDAFYEALKELNPEIIVLGGGWHELIPERVYSYPIYGCINTHPSLLPEFRGTSITRWQVLHGIEKSGSTIHYVDGKFDTGGMLAQKELQLGKLHTIGPQQLFYKLGEIGADIMVELLHKIKVERKILSSNVVEHNPKYYNYFKRWRWDEKKLFVDWSQTLKEIHFFVLSCTQEHYKYLGPIIYINGQTYFLRKTRVLEKTTASTFETDELYWVELANKNLALTKNSSEYLLEVCQIQKYEANKSLTHRALNPKRILKEQINKRFSNE
ncbi:methionyl-tRNA formyltransferase [Flavicella sediminum]|uniref:methionyl-tRNA formyltransferase n=1 Tax=Flavicella sediminum TaxID=2585141 RepID=UPI00111FCE03|nr:formyltransferase family protein [Flavicella sediminum]